MARKDTGYRGQITRREFINTLEAGAAGETGKAVKLGHVQPKDELLSCLGQGLSVFSAYESVLNADGSAMRVHDALQVIYLECEDYIEQRKAASSENAAESKERSKVCWRTMNWCRKASAFYPLMAGYIGQEFSRVYKNDWWQEILDALSDQYDLPTSGDYGELIDSLGVMNCFRLIDRRWNEVFRTKLSLDYRTWSKELVGVRNRAAHIGGQDFFQELCRESFGYDGTSL